MPLQQPVSSPRRIGAQGIGARAALACVAAITLAGAWLRFLHLGRASLWIDEACSAFYTTLDWNALGQLLTTAEANMALYYVLLHEWAHLGHSEFALRSLSAVAGIAAIPAIYALGRAMFGRWTGVLAALLLAMNSFHLAYAQEARAYSLVVLLVVLSGLLLVRAVESNAIHAWVLYAIVSLLAVYSHFFAALVLAAQWAAVLLMRPRGLRWGRFFLCVSAVVVMCSPLAVYVITRGRGNLEWVAPPTMHDLVKLLLSFAGTRMLAAEYIALCALALVVYVRRRSAFGEERWRMVLLFSWFLLPIAIAFLLSLRQPMFVDRYLIVCLPAFLLLGAAGLAQISNRWMSTAALVLLLVLAARDLRSYESRPVKEDWRAASEFVLRNGSPQDATIFYLSTGHFAFNYYAALEGASAQRGTMLYPVDWRVVVEPRAADYAQLKEKYPRVWLVETHLISPEREEAAHAVEATLAAEYPVAREEQFAGVDVREYALSAK